MPLTSLHLCRLVEGMPLGIELAASWADLLSLEAIAAEIQANLDFLETDVRNISDRHRSIRAVFETSWKRLGRDEREVFAQLSVFRGGFTRKAALEVAGASLRQLARSVEQVVAAIQEVARSLPGTRVAAPVRGRATCQRSVGRE